MTARKLFSTSWRSSTQPRKQRKYLYNAPLHHLQNLVKAHLSPDLRKKYAFRSFQVRKGDKVQVLRGSHSRKQGRVEAVSLKRRKVFVAGVEAIKKDGTKIPLPLDPSNLMILELEINDPRRKQKLELKSKPKPKSPASKPGMAQSETKAETIKTNQNKK